MVYFDGMRYIELTELEKETMGHCFKNHTKAHVRMRSQSLMLSDEGWTVKQIALLHRIRRRTIYTWFDRWESLGIAGIDDLARTWY